MRSYACFEVGFVVIDRNPLPPTRDRQSRHVIRPKEHGMSKNDKQPGPPEPDEPARQRDNPHIELEQVKLGTIIKLAGIRVKLTLEGTAPAQGILALAMAIAVVTAFGGAIAAILIALSAPVWAALILAALPTLALGAGIVIRQRSSRVADAGRILGQPRAQGLAIDAGGDEPDDPDDETGDDATR
jgi:hypothetical protein